MKLYLCALLFGGCAFALGETFTGIKPFEHDLQTQHHLRGRKLCDLPSLSDPDCTPNYLDPPPVPESDFYAVFNEVCACNFSTYVRGKFIDDEGSLDFWVGIYDEEEDPQDPNEIYLPSFPYTNEIIGEYPVDEDTWIARKTEGAILGMLKGHPSMPQRRDTIDPYAALSNGLPLTAPMMFWMQNGTHISLGTSCSYNNETTSWACSKGHVSVLTGEVRDLCSELTV